MRSQSCFVVGFFLILVVLSCDIGTTEGRRCTRICEKGRCRPVCLRDTADADRVQSDEVEPMRRPDGP